MPVYEKICMDITNKRDRFMNVEFHVETISPQEAAQTLNTPPFTVFVSDYEGQTQELLDRAIAARDKWPGSLRVPDCVNHYRAVDRKSLGIGKYARLGVLQEKLIVLDVMNIPALNRLNSRYNFEDDDLGTYTQADYVTSFVAFLVRRERSNDEKKYNIRLKFARGCWYSTGDWVDYDRLPPLSCVEAEEFLSVAEQWNSSEKVKAKPHYRTADPFMYVERIPDELRPLLPESSRPKVSQSLGNTPGPAMRLAL